MRSARTIAAACFLRLRRIVAPIFVGFAVLLSSGCAILEMEKTNRGGYLDHVIDRHWMKADSKSMRALRALAIQVSLARLASVSAKNESDRQLLAIRIGALTKRFSPIYACAFDTNPLGVPGAESDPCFYFDSAMVDYSTGLFDLAMIALPIEDARKLVSSVAGSAVNPINILELLDSLLSIARDAIRLGRVAGALYRDTVELEVQVWLGTPAVDNRPPPHLVTEADVTRLRGIYAARNDNMSAWLTEIAALRTAGLEPVPQRKFFAELGGLMRYICDLITKEVDAVRTCKAGLPTTLSSPPSVLSSTGTVGSVFTPGGTTRPAVVTGPGTSGTQVGARPSRPDGTPAPDYGQIIIGYDPAVHKPQYVQNVLSKLCVRTSERSVTPRMNSLIKVYQLYAYGGEIEAGRKTISEVVTGKLTPTELTTLTGVSGSCPDDRANYYEWRDNRFSRGINAQAVVNLVNRKVQVPLQLPAGASTQAVREKVLTVRAGLAGTLLLKDDALANQFTPDLVTELRK